MVTNNSANTYIVPTANHEVTQPLQPAFLAYLASYDNNRTGTGTVYTLGTNVAFTEVFDQNADFNTNGTFTASVTGRYLLIYVIRVFGTNNNYSIYIEIVTSNRTYKFNKFNVTGIGEVGVGFQTIADMDASDTVTFKVVGTGIGSDIVNIQGYSEVTFVSGFLIS